ncbi:MAG TPA: crotonase/enoyl-CoA hydratase family protein [Ramlibacter sp.]|nr:crotonase/enoyl-CoA hydratase family protein [Ramlibacter sp.]
MNSEPRVRVQVDGQGVCEVVLARPDKMNALDAAMFQAIRDAIERVRNDPAVRVVLLHGEGRAFCAGLDKGNFEASAAGGNLVDDLLPRTHGKANAWQQVAWGWRQLPVPVIAAVHGVALGGGLQIALGADVRLVHPQAKLGVLEIQWGIVPDMAGCALLTELVRPDVARELTYTGRMVSGAEAVALGLATRVCEDPLAEARELARQIAARNPGAVRSAKRLFNDASPVDAAAVLLAESREQQAILGTENQVEAVRAALERRAPRFR